MNDELYSTELVEQNEILAAYNSLLKRGEKQSHTLARLNIDEQQAMLASGLIAAGALEQREAEGDDSPSILGECFVIGLVVGIEMDKRRNK